MSDVMYVESVGVLTDSTSDTVSINLSLYAFRAHATLVFPRGDGVTWARNYFPNSQITLLDISGGATGGSPIIIQNAKT